jgi:predicted esterase
MVEAHLKVQRTARYHVLGDPRTAGELWFAVHGMGQLARYFLNMFEGLEGGRCIVAPEALSRFYLDRTFSRVGATWMTREDREAEIQDHVAYLDALADVLLAECPPGTPLHALGFSQGVATVSRWAFHGHARLHRVVLWGGTMPPEFDPVVLAERWKVLRIDLVHGDADDVVGPEAMAKNAAQLRRAGLEARTHRYDGGHELDALTLARLLAG